MLARQLTTGDNKFLVTTHKKVFNCQTCIGNEIIIVRQSHVDGCERVSRKRDICNRERERYDGWWEEGRGEVGGVKKIVVASRTMLRLETREKLNTSQQEVIPVIGQQWMVI